MKFTPTGSRVSYTLPATYKVRTYDNRYFGNGWTARATCGSEVLCDTTHETRTWARRQALELCFNHWQAALIANR